VVISFHLYVCGATSIAEEKERWSAVCTTCIIIVVVSSSSCKSAWWSHISSPVFRSRTATGFVRVYMCVIYIGRTLCGIKTTEKKISNGYILYMYDARSYPTEIIIIWTVNTRPDGQICMIGKNIERRNERRGGRLDDRWVHREMVLIFCHRSYI